MPGRTYTMVMAVAVAGSALSGAFLLPASPATPPPSMVMMAAYSPSSSSAASRRQAVAGGLATILAGVALTSPLVSLAEEASTGVKEVPLVRDKLGGLLEPYSDIAKGLKLLKPSGWNEFQGTPETYIVKWEDIINKDEAVILNSTPVKSTTSSVTALGDVKEVGEKLAKARSAELVDAIQRSTEGFTFYEFEFKGDKQNELLEFVVGKGRLWSLSATAAAKRWSRRKDAYKNILGSFAPKL